MAIDLNKVKKLYNEGYYDNEQTTKTQNTWERLLSVANQNLQQFQNNQSSQSSQNTKKRSIWDDLGNTFQTVWKGITSGVKNVPYYYANVQERNQEFAKNTEQQFMTNPKTSAEEKAKVNNVGLNQIAVANSEGEAKEKFKQNLEIAINEKPETNLIKKALAESIQKDQEVIEQKQEEIENPVVKKVAEVAPSIGQMIPGMALSAINPGAGALYFASSSGGSYIKDALDRGMNDKEATLYGTLMGAMEGATEMIGVENISKAGKTVGTLIKGAGKQAVKEGAKGIEKATIKTALKQYGIGITDNVIQESIMEPIQETIASAVGGKDKANWENMGQRMLQSGINGGLCSAIMGGANMGINSCVAVVDKIQNGQIITQQEIQKATKDVNKEVNVEGLITDSIQHEVNKYNNSANENQIATNLQNNLPQNPTNTPANQQVQQTSQQIQKVAQNGDMSQINANAQNQQQNVRQQEINSLKQRAEKELTGSEKTEILDFLNNTPNIDASSLNSVSQVINMARNDTLNTDETYKTGRQQKYVKYMNKTNKYDPSALQQAKEIVPANNQGRRTKEQWLQVAEQIGNNIADKSATEIEEIAYRTWQEERPASKESLNRQGKKYVQFTSDDWINTIYNTVKKIDSQNSNLQTNGNVANNQNLVYNNGESRVDVNERGQNVNERSNGEIWNGNAEESTETNRRYNWEEYDRWEQSIKPIETERLAENEIKSIKDAKTDYNKTVRLYDENENDNTYSGGASKNVPGQVNISRQQAQYFGLGYMIAHENVESDIMHNEEANDILEPVKKAIIRDSNFSEQKNNFWEGQQGNMPTDELIAKDIICDRFAERKGQKATKYINVLTNTTRNTIDMALENYYKQVYGKELANFNYNTENSSKSSFSVQESSNSTQQLRLPTKENIKKVNQNKNIPLSQNVQQSSAQKEPNVPLSKNMKQRKHYKSIIESNYTSAEAKKIAKELIGTDTYVPESNKKQLARADQRISISGAENELNSLLSRAITGGNIKADDIAVGERLIQYYSKIGDKVKLQDAVQATGMAGTTAGQTVQALSMLNHQTPEGQAIWIQRSVDKMNNDLARQKGGEIVRDEDGNIRVIRKNGKDITDKVELFNLTPDMIDKIVNSKNTQDLQNNVNQIYDELGQQVTKSTMQKIDSWRYFSMLFNIRTHLRNVVGNTAMGATQKAKNKVAGIIEGVVSKVNPEMERTHTIVPASKEVKAFAKSDIDNVADRLGLNDNKYNPKSRLENSMRTFKSNAMENTVGKLFKFNDNALEAEDGFGLKRAYRNALAEYMTANKLTPENITDSQLSKARNHAIEQAKEATFHQESKIASLLNQLQNKNKFAKATLDATLPFKKTPINVAKAGMEYSPAGLIKSIVYDSTQLRKGNITANQYIDNISKGLTGTGIALVGYALADMGILKASGGDDDKKEKYDEAMGNQTYAITIGDKTYSLDWLSPTGIPLFIGAELKQIANAQAKTNNSSTDSDSIQNKIGEAGNNLINALSNAMSPMAEMSMLSGLTSTLQSYEQGSSQFLAELIGGGVQSYTNQFIPTLSGQIAKTIDDKERSTTSTKTGVFSKKLDQTKNQMMNKIPGLRQMLPTKTDIWGNEIKQNENWVARAFENGVLPWAQKDKASSKVNEELNSIYEKTGESSIYPTTIEKKLTLNGENYMLTNDEFSKYQKDYGQTSYKLIDSLVNSKDYTNMTDTQKQKAIEEIYKYAKEKNKIDYAKKVNKDVEKSTLSKTLEELKTNGGSQSDYISYTAKIDGVKKDKEKNEILSKSNYSNATKSIIYKNTTGSEDDLYNNLLSKDNINLDQYLNYKLQEFTSDKEDDGTLSGKSISGSKKKKVYDYVNNMDITPMQRVALKGSQYKLSRTDQQDLFNYINNMDISTTEERTEIFKKFSTNFTIYKNGTLSFK